MTVATQAADRVARKAAAEGLSVADYRAAMARLHDAARRSCSLFDGECEVCDGSGWMRNGPCPECGSEMPRD